MVKFRAMGDILDGVAGFVGEDGKGGTFLEPGEVGGPGGAVHGLLDELDFTIGGEPFEHGEGLFLGAPAFIGIDADGFVRGGGAEGGEVFTVAGVAQFQFQDGVGGGFGGFPADGIGGGDADAEGGDMPAFAEAEAEEIVEGLAGAFGGAIEEGKVQGAGGGRLPGGEGGEVSHAAGEIIEGEPGDIDLG